MPQPGMHIRQLIILIGKSLQKLTRRLNKDMAQLGWAAGFAVRECMEGNLDDVRLVDVTQIQKKSGFKENVQRLMDKYK